MTPSTVTITPAPIAFAIAAPPITFVTVAAPATCPTPTFTAPPPPPPAPPTIGPNFTASAASCIALGTSSRPASSCNRVTAFATFARAACNREYAVCTGHPTASAISFIVTCSIS